ncbi:MAG: hypothetical protein IJJ42_03030 [Clostridia bacterium]|nr:hypothetical protein [Clostridia bacterium]
MKGTMKRILSVMLTVSVILSSFPVLAEEEQAAVNNVNEAAELQAEGTDQGSAQPGEKTGGTEEPKDHGSAALFGVAVVDTIEGAEEPELTEQTINVLLYTDRSMTQLINGQAAPQRNLLKSAKNTLAAPQTAGAKDADGETSISISGELPEGAYAVGWPVDIGDEITEETDGGLVRKAEVLGAYQLELYNADGTKIESTETPVTVNLKLASRASKGNQQETDKVEVVPLSGDGSVNTKSPMKTQSSGSTLTYTTKVLSGVALLLQWYHVSNHMAIHFTAADGLGLADWLDAGALIELQRMWYTSAICPEGQSALEALAMQNRDQRIVAHILITDLPEEGSYSLYSIIDEQGNLSEEAIQEDVKTGDVIDVPCDSDVYGFALVGKALDSTVLSVEDTNGTYRVTVQYDSMTGIPMKGTKLVVEEIDRESETYDTYYTSASEALNGMEEGRLFEIHIEDEETGKICQPAEGTLVDVLIELLNNNYRAGTEAHVVHLGDTAEVLDVDVTRSGDDYAYAFRTGSFSPFMVSYTVDFYYNGYRYSINGESSILVSTLFDRLHINVAPEDVSDISFSDNRLMGITKEGADWRLTSLSAFDTKESLIIHLADRQDITIKVTDDQLVDVYFRDEWGNEVAAQIASGHIQTVVSQILNGAYSQAYYRAFERPTSDHSSTGTRIYWAWNNSGVVTVNTTDYYPTPRDGNTRNKTPDTDIVIVLHNNYTYNEQAGIFSKVETYSVDSTLSTDDLLVMFPEAFAMDEPIVWPSDAEKAALDANNIPGAQNENTSSDVMLWKNTSYDEVNDSLKISLSFFQRQTASIEFLILMDVTGTMDTWLYGPVVVDPNNEKGMIRPRARQYHWARGAALKATQTLLNARSMGYDIRVSLYSMSGGTRKIGTFTDFDSALADVNADTNVGGGTNHRIAITTLTQGAEAATAAGYTPFVIYLSDFHSTFDSVTDNELDALNDAAEVYGILMFDTWTTARQTRMNRLSQGGHVYHDTNSDNPTTLFTPFPLIIDDAIGYVDRDKKISDELYGSLVTMAGIGFSSNDVSDTSDSVTLSSGTLNWQLANGNSRLRSARVYTKEITIPLVASGWGNSVYSGSMPTNGKCSVADGDGTEINSISAANSPLLKKPLTLLKKTSDTNGIVISSAKFTLARGSNTWTDLTSDVNGAVSIPWAAEDSATAAAFKAGDVYTLTEDSTSDGTVRPGGSWTLTVNEDYSITATTTASPTNTNRTKGLEAKDGKLEVYNDTEPAVIYNANGGMFAGSATTQTDTIDFANTEISTTYTVADSIVPTRDGGWMFTGWNTETDGSGTAYAAGDIIENIYRGSSDTFITLYAQWQEIIDLTVTKNWVEYGEVTNPNESITLTFKDSDGLALTVDTAANAGHAGVTVNADGTVTLSKISEDDGEGNTIQVWPVSWTVTVPDNAASIEETDVPGYIRSEGAFTDAAGGKTVTITNTRAVCKVMDNGTFVKAYSTLEAAFDDINKNKVNGDRIEMLVPEYKLTNCILMNKNKAITLTTADPSATDGYPYTGTGKATIIRAWNGSNERAKSMFHLTHKEASFTTLNIILNGKEGDTQHTGRAIYAYSGSLTIGNGTEIRNFSTEGDGGAINFFDFDQTGTMTVSNSIFSNCSAGNSNGGGVYYKGKEKLTISNTSFTGCAAANGGALCSRAGSIDIEINNSTFSQCRAAAKGGTIQVLDPINSGTGAGSGTMIMTGCTIEDGSAESGSAIYLGGTSAQIYMNGGNITGNRSTGIEGGAIEVTDVRERLFIAGSIQITGNTNRVNEESNIYLNQPSARIIQAGYSQGGTAFALSDGAEIGVFVSGDQNDTTSNFGKYGNYGKPFGEYAANNDPGYFKNDILNVRGVNNKEDATDKRMYWDKPEVTMTVVKTVSGAMGDTTREFSFTVSGLTNGTQTAWKKLGKTAEEGVYTQLTTGGEGTETANSEGKITFTLKNWQKIELTLPSGTDLTLEESAATGYDTWMVKQDTAITDEQKAVADNKTNSITVNESDDYTVQVLNNLDAVSPTGISFTYAPYILMLLCGAALMLLGQKKRRA